MPSRLDERENPILYDNEKEKGVRYPTDIGHHEKDAATDEQPEGLVQKHLGGQVAP